MTEERTQTIDFTVDRQNLYLEETFTDLRVASIRRLTPVTSDGAVDKTRKTIFVGETHLMTAAGPLPVQTLIPAKQLQQAIKRFPEAMQAAVEKLAEEAHKMRQKEQSQIITPTGKEQSRIIIPGR
ncbi:MAG: cytoplasmic protein [Deltaproteobacteria bacterium]|nr:cytoplasmic protein [Deltaproteobacteria bacterium]